jgi:sugar/nucleoside kinase (ribokinase family)
MAKFELLCVGDSTVDIFAFPEQSHIHCQYHGSRRCELCLEFADKIPTKGFNLTFGGNAANVAVGASRLGVKTGIYTHLGDDTFGKETLKNFRKEKVATSLVKVDKGARTNVGLILSVRGERTILSFHEGRKYNLPFDSVKGKYKPLSQWLYFSSLAPHHDKLHRQIPEFITETGAKMIFNPGTHQIKEGRKVLAPILEHSEVLILNRDEAGQLLGVRHSLKDERVLLRRLRHLGPRMVVVTDGPHGAYGFDSLRFAFQKVYPLKVV